MRIAAIATTAILLLTGAFFAGSQNETVKIETKTVTKVDPVQNCVISALKQYGADTVIPECGKLNDYQQEEALAIIDTFLDAMFSETYEG